MRTSTSQFIKRALILPVALSSLVLGSTTPAAAQPTGEVTGAGGGTGFEYPHGDQIINDCIPDLVGTFPGSTFVLTHEGTYDGVDHDVTPLAAYVGTTTVTMQTGPYIIGPEGTYTSCINGEVPVPGAVPLNSAHVVGNEGTGSVNCPAQTGTFQRRAFDVVTFTLRGQCTVKGNLPPLDGQVVDGDVTHVITGIMQPCTVPVPPLDTSVPEECLLDPNAGSVLVTDYVVLPE